MKHPKDTRKTILIVEDEPSICQVCVRTLAVDGFDVDIAINGAIAEDMLGKKEYDLCLIDVRTPVMNGKELYQHIEEKYPDFTNKIIFTTAAALDDKVASLLKRAKRPYLPKPFTPDELRTIVRQALKG
jgi:DNA-binding response OmpR family regulator